LAIPKIKKGPIWYLIFSNLCVHGKVSFSMSILFVGGDTDLRLEKPPYFIVCD